MTQTKMLRRGSDEHQIVSWTDLEVSISLPFLVLISWFLPPSVWQFVSRRISRLLSAILVWRTKREIRFLQDLLEGREPNDRLDDIQIQLRGDKILQLCEYLREMRPGGWRPKISLSGTEHIDHALRTGAGVILWVVPARSSGLIVKRGLKDAGYSIAHLSRSFHGMSRSLYGRVVLNKIIVNNESKYLSHRVLVDEEENMRSIRWVREFLKNRGILSISMSRLGKQRITVKVLGSSIDLATGAPNLALRTGAALLPVVTRPGNAGVFEVKIEPSIEQPATLNRTDAIRQMTEKFGRLLERELAEINPASPICWFVGTSTNAE